MSFLRNVFSLSGRRKVWWTLVLVIVLTVWASLIVVGDRYNATVAQYNLPLPQVKERPFRLGLDLLGGSQLTYDADTSAVPAGEEAMAVEGARDVIERRVNAFGVSEPIVQVNRAGEDNYRIIIELAGITDIGEAIKQIGETPLLEFKEANDELRELSEEEKKTMEENNAKAQTRAEDILGMLGAGQDFGDLARSFSDDEFTKEDGGYVGWVSKLDNPEIASLVESLEPGQFTPQLARTSFGFEILKLNNKNIREVNVAQILVCYQDNEDCESELNRDQAYELVKEIKDKATPENFNSLLDEYHDRLSPKSGELGWVKREVQGEVFDEVAFNQEIGTVSFIAESKFGFHLLHKKDENPEYDLSHILITTTSEEDIIGPQSEWKNTELTGKNLRRASVQLDPNNGLPTVNLEFDNDGAKFFEQITERNVGRPVGIFLDGLPISTPNVNEKITGGQAVIQGNFTMVEARELVKRLNSGALPLPITLVSQQTVGASLGQESVEMSLQAAMIGLILVMIFMVIFYRFLGVVSVFSLVIYGLLTLAVFKLWPVTLTLSGIAGFILSIGMAVDANILIFERLKEELKAGKSFSSAIQEGFNRAWPSIRDSNFTTILVCFVLIQFTTSSIKGFAITLLIGVLLSMFSAITVTRTFLRLFKEGWMEKHPKLVGYKRPTGENL